MIGLALCTLIMLFAVSCSNKDVKPSRPDNLGPDETVNGFLKAMNNCNYEEVKLYIVNGDKCDAHGIYNADTLIEYYSELPSIFLIQYFHVLNLYIYENYKQVLKGGLFI